MGNTSAPPQQSAPPEAAPPQDETPAAAPQQPQQPAYTPPPAPRQPDYTPPAAPQQPVYTQPAAPRQPAYVPPARPSYAPPAAPQPVSASMSEGDTPVKKKSNIALIAIIAAVAVVAIVGISLAVNRYVVPLFSGGGSDARTMAVFSGDDGMMAANGNKVLLLGEDTADYDGWEPLCYTADGKRFVYFDDVADGLGTLYVGPAGGNAEKVDSDVVIGQILVTPGAVMYQVQDGSDLLLRLYDGKDVIELAEDPQEIGTWCCSDDGSFVSYMVYDKNGDSVGYYWYDGEEYSLSENTVIVYISANGKAAYAAEFGGDYNDKVATLYALTDIKQTQAVPVGEDVGPLVIDAATGAVAFMSDYDPADGTGDLCFAKFGKEAVEIDNKVSALHYIGGDGFMTSAGTLYGGAAYSIAPSFDGELYYVRKATLYASPFKADKSVELIDDTDTTGVYVQKVNGTLYWQDGKDIASYKAGSLKAPESWRPDAAADGFYVLKSNSILSTEDDELFLQAFGSDGDAVSLLDSADDYDFAGMSPDEKFIYYMDDDELLFISIKGGKETSVTDDIEDIDMTTAGIYMLVDYDSDDGGDLYYVAYGKAKAVKIAEGVMDLTSITYVS